MRAAEALELTLLSRGSPRPETATGSVAEHPARENAGSARPSHPASLHTGSLNSSVAPDLVEFQSDELGRFFELSADLFCIVGFDGCFRVLNRAWELALGFSREELLGTSWAELVHPDDRTWSMLEAQAIAASGRIFSQETRCRCKDGSYKWLLWNATAVADQEVIYATARDITDRKQAEAALRQAHAELETRVRQRTEELARSNEILFAEITHCKRIEASLWEAQEKFRSMFENAVEGMFQSTPEGAYISVNPALARIKGYDSPEELMCAVDDIGQQSYVDPNRRVEFKSLMERNGIVNAFEYQVYRKDRKKAWLSMNARAVRNPEGQVVYYEGTIEDVTERKRLEDQLRLGQKMEAVGQLAGGIAHDFNNLLSVILGHSELLSENLDQESPLRNHVEQINRASESAALLVGQLLSFSRKKAPQPAVLDLNSVVSEVTKMLARLIGENIVLTTALDSQLGQIKADRGLVEQIIVNLAVNARDAMPSGGRLTIETANVQNAGALAGAPGGSPGAWVALTVSDTGVGMDAETQSHIFEPFFTTKVRGKGTGLGLATVYGAVKQSGGTISVHSELGQGTSFKILLPRTKEIEADLRRKDSAELFWRGTETILLVEDDTVLRELTRNLLTRRGYRVLEAANGAAALRMAKSFQGPIHLVLSDVVMPGSSGPQLAMELRPLRPDIKVLLMSGYVDFAGGDQIRRSGEVLLQKPFTQNDLVVKVREALTG